MKIRIFNPLVIIILLSLFFIWAVLYIPSSLIRIILGLPFLLLFPGYNLMSVIFKNRVDMDAIELVSLSIITSIAVSGLIGFGLNFTASGITLETVLVALGAFIVLTAVIGLIQQAVSPKGMIIMQEFRLRVPAGSKKFFLNPLTPVLLASIVVAVAVLGYSSFSSKASEKYTEFYVLGLYGKAQDYPVEFTLENGKTVQVAYDSGIDTLAGQWGKVTLGIVNQQAQTTTYRVRIAIDGDSINLNYSGEVTQELMIKDLSPGARWEGEIGFAPRHTGEKQKVEFFLFKDLDNLPFDTLQLFINAGERLAQ